MSSTFETQTQITLTIQYGYSWEGDYGLHYRYRVNHCNGGTITRNQLQRIQEIIDRLRSATEEGVPKIFHYDQIKSVEIRGNLNEIEKIPAIFKARCDYYQTEEILLKKSFSDSYAYLTRNLQIIATPASSMIEELSPEGGEILRSGKGRQVPCRSQIDSSAPLELPVQTLHGAIDLTSESSDSESRGSIAASSPSPVAQSASPLPPPMTASWDDVRDYLVNGSY